MRFLVFCVTLVLWGTIMAGTHYDAYPESTLPFTHTHETSICYGYAMARALGKTTGDVFCPPELTHVIHGIDTTKFPFVPGESLVGIKAGDIVVFGEIRDGRLGHAAFVVSVPKPLTNIGDILVDQVPYETGPEQTNVKLDSVIHAQGQGKPVGYHKRSHQVSAAITFRNNFLAGVLHVDKNRTGDWITKDHGESVYFDLDTTFNLSKGDGGRVEIEAVDRQMYNGYKQKFRRWEVDYKIKSQDNYSYGF